MMLQRSDRGYFWHDAVWRAYNVAYEQHDGQLRKYTDEPYIVHPVAVADILWDFMMRSDTPLRARENDVLSAALLHDTIEDTEYTQEELWDEFGPVIGYMVYYLTDISRPEDGNRATRKAMDAAHYARGPAETQTIKVADLIDNTKSIAEYDPDFWQVYLKEKERMLDLLTLAEPGLVEVARRQVGAG